MKKVLISLAVIGFAAPAFAQADLLAPEFTSVDADASGDLTFEEVAAVAPDLTADLFAQADADANGSLSEAEFTILVESGVATFVDPMAAPLDGETETLPAE